MRTIITFMLALNLLWLGGCATLMSKTSGDDSSANIALTDSSHLQLSPSPASLTGRGFLSLVKGKHQQQDYQLLVQVELSQDRIVMVGTTVNGMELFELLWFPDRPYQLKQSTLAKEIKVAYLLADFQLVHWPVASLNQYLQGALVIESPDGKKRVIKQGKQPLITIQYQTKALNQSKAHSDVTVQNHHRQYTVSIKTLEKWTF